MLLLLLYLRCFTINKEPNNNEITNRANIVKPVMPLLIYLWPAMKIGGKIYIIKLNAQLNGDCFLLFLVVSCLRAANGDNCL